MPPEYIILFGIFLLHAGFEILEYCPCCIIVPFLVFLLILAGTWL